MLCFAFGCGARTAPPVDVEPDATAPDGGEAAIDGGVDAGICTPHAESCDGTDDDCDGRIDEGLPFGARGEVLVLREDEGETGRCVSCRWAFNPELVPRRGGWFALWTLGIDGGREQPSFFRRPLSARGIPTGDVTIIDETVPLFIDRVLRGPGADDTESTTLSGVLREAAGDVRYLLRVDLAGAITRGRVSGERAPRAWDGTVATDRGVLLVEHELGGGEAHLFVRHFDLAFDEQREERVPAADGLNPVVVVAARESASAGEAAAAAFVSLGHRGSRRWLLVLLDAEGGSTAVGADLPPESQITNAVGTAAGWVVWTTDGSTSLVHALTPTGELLGEEETALPPALNPRSHGATVGSRGERVHYAWHSGSTRGDTDVHVGVADSRGSTLQEWTGPAPRDPRYPGVNYVADPTPTLLDDGAFLLIWHSIAPNGSPNQVLLQEYGCVSPAR